MSKLTDTFKAVIEPLRFLIDRNARNIESVASRPTPVQPDMAINNPQSAAYVKNRLCYIRDDGTVIPLKKEFIPVSEIALSELRSDDKHCHVSLEEKNAWDNKRGVRGTGVCADVFNDGANDASGDYSHAEGDGTEASGLRSHTEGYQTTARGINSHAEGFGTSASGMHSHAEGHDTIARGSSAHAEGMFTRAASTAQHVQGKYNIEDDGNKYAHIVGNGSSWGEASNAHTLDWNGLGWFAGGLKVGGTSQDDETAKTVIATATPTASDSGKIPVVQSDGSWGLVSIPNAEEASF